MIRAAFAAACLPLLFVALPPPTPPLLELAEILRSVQDSHPYLGAAGAKVDSAVGKVLSAQGVYDPEIIGKGEWVMQGVYPYTIFNTQVRQTTPLWGTRLIAGYRRSGGKLPLYKDDSPTGKAGEIYGGVELPVLKNGSIDRRRANLRVSEQGLVVATAERDGTLLRLRREATEAYWAWTAAVCQQRIENDLLVLAVARNASLARMVQHGEMPQIDLIENQRAILQRRERLFTAERKVQATAIKLSLYWRSPEGMPQRPQMLQALADFPELPTAQPWRLAADLSLAQQQRPELQRFRAQQAAAGVELELAGNSARPKLDLMLGAARDVQVPAQTSAAWRTGLQFSVPLPLREARGKRDAAQAEAIRLRLEQAYARDKIVAEVQDVHSALIMAHHRRNIIIEEIAVARQVEMAEKERYRLGESSLLLVNLREMATTDAQKRRVDIYSEYWVAWATYQAVLAVRS